MDKKYCITWIALIRIQHIYHKPPEPCDDTKGLKCYIESTLAVIGQDAADNPSLGDILPGDYKRGKCYCHQDSGPKAWRYEEPPTRPHDTCDTPKEKGGSRKDPRDHNENCHHKSDGDFPCKDGFTCAAEGSSIHNDGTTPDEWDKEHPKDDRGSGKCACKSGLVFADAVCKKPPTPKKHGETCGHGKKCADSFKCGVGASVGNSAKGIADTHGKLWESGKEDGKCVCKASGETLHIKEDDGAYCATATTTTEKPKMVTPKSSAGNGSNWIAYQLIFSIAALEILFFA